MRRIALCGNPNSGKTTLFNALTGLNLHTGNYNGVTISAYEANLTKDIVLCDLPGIFSSYPETPDEEAACDYIKNFATEAIIIADGTSFLKVFPIIEAISQSKIPAVMIITMADMMRRDGIFIDLGKLSSVLGIPVFTSERNMTKKAYEFIISAEYHPVNKITLNDLETLVSGDANDNIHKFDKLLFTSILWTLLPALVLLPIILIYAVFSPAISDTIAFFVDFLQNMVCLRIGAAPYLLRLFITEAIFGGIFTIVEFLPAIVLIIAYLTFLEESGIAPRLAVIFSPIAKVMGISCRAVISFILGFGCTVPALEALRAVDKNSAERASIILPFFQCSAKIPVFSLFISVFFTQISVLSIILIYIFTILFAFFAGSIINFLHKTTSAEMITELPRYRVPSLRVIYRNSFDKCKELVQKIVTVLFILSVIIWFLNHLDLSFHFIYDENFKKSILYQLGSFISPLFTPLGFGNPIVSVSIISGLFAKEGVITSLSVCAGSDGIRFILKELFDCASAVSFLCFFTIYPPCVSAFTMLVHEFGLAHAAKCIFIQFFLAYFTSLILYNVLCIVL